VVRPVARVLQQVGQNSQGGQDFYTILDACSNQRAKHETRRTYFKWGDGHHWPPADDGPDCGTKYALRVT